MVVGSVITKPILEFRNDSRATLSRNKALQKTEDFSDRDAQEENFTIPRLIPDQTLQKHSRWPSLILDLTSS